MIASVIVIGMFYIILALSGNPDVAEMEGGEAMQSILFFGTIIAGVFAVIFLFYTNSFLMKRRKKEFGLFNILGMEKRHISKIILSETLIVSFINIAVGLLWGILFSKLALLIIAKLFATKLSIGFYVSSAHIIITLAVFLGVFFLVLCNNLIQVYRSKPIELLKGGQVGEKEPKAHWILSILGFIGLAVGYYLSVTTEKPIKALNVFFIAVILVVISTYLLFTSGSITILKALKKNKKYYYKSNHFIMISGMIYRMKQNAVGLANICVLSTMVLVMISTTLSMFIGADEIIKEVAPSEFEVSTHNIDIDNDEVLKYIEDVVESKNQKIENMNIYPSLQSVGIMDGENVVGTKQKKDGKAIYIHFLQVDYYNQIMGENETLEDNEVLIANSSENPFPSGVFNFMGDDYNVKSVIKEKVLDPQNAAYFDYVLVFVKDFDAMLHLQDLEQNNSEIGNYNINYFFSFDVDAPKTILSEIEEELKKQEDITVRSRQTVRNDFMSVYGGLFFIGVFLGLLFIIAMILIIYYKQISEGYEDRERFQIMKKVGLSTQETKKAIRTQILNVFFLPLITAVIHLAFAFPMIIRLLKLLNMVNVPLFINCTVGCILVFAFFYAIVYSLTAKSYYKIVE